MGFSFRISEAEYVLSATSHVKGHTSSKVGLCIYFILSAMCLHLLIMLTYSQITSTERLPLRLALALYLPFIGLIVVPALWHIVWVPRRFARNYRKSQVLQSEMRVAFSTRGFSRDADFGEPVRTGWERYRYWREFHDIILLVESSNDWEFTPISMKGLQDWQRENLRELMSGILPKK